MCRFILSILLRLNDPSLNEPGGLLPLSYCKQPSFGDDSRIVVAFLLRFLLSAF